MFKKALPLTFLILLQATDALAIQEHGDPEGYFVHQIAHIIFIAAMVFLMVVLKKPTVARLAGWRSIRYAALFFLIWNVDAYLSHMASYRMEPREAYITGSVIHLREFSARIYYYASLSEHVFLVSAFVFLALGLYQLEKHLKTEAER